MLDSSPLEDELEEPVPLDDEPVEDSLVDGELELVEDSLVDGELELVEDSLPVVVFEDLELVEAPLEAVDAAFSVAAPFFADSAGSCPDAS